MFWLWCSFSQEHIEPAGMFVIHTMWCLFFISPCLQYQVKKEVRHTIFAVSHTLLADCNLVLSLQYNPNFHIMEHCRICSWLRWSIRQFIYALIGRNKYPNMYSGAQDTVSYSVFGTRGQMPVHICFDILISYASCNMHFLQVILIGICVLLVIRLLFLDNFRRLRSSKTLKKGMSYKTINSICL